jgi:hypothetical protein
MVWAAAACWFCPNPNTGRAYGQVTVIGKYNAMVVVLERILKYQYLALYV